MDTAVRTPLEIFTLPQHLVIPLFQRPYVWDEENQWAPLWGDIRRLTELRLAQPYTKATHFLGAIVLQHAENLTSTLQPRLVVDGQQRLTTLQLLLDAAAAVFESMDLEHLSGQLEGLTHNSQHFVQREEDTLKLRHSNRDRAVFDEVMQGDPPIAYDTLTHGRSLLARAHRFFAERVSSWLASDSDIAVAQRAKTLTAAMTTGLQLVVIDLRAEENSQEIFETLNARGTPLTAADLIKNFVFQRLATEGVDAHHAYAELWPFDSDYWEKEVSVGRYPISRGSLFLNQWLISRVGEEIGPKSTFNRFKHYVEHESGRKMADVLVEIKTQAETYRQWSDRAADPHAPLTRVELCVYRTQAAEIEIIKSILIWLHEPDAGVGTDTIERVVEATESWLLRRALLRASMGDLARVVAELISTHRGVADGELASRVEAFLTRLNAVSTYWPGDEELRSSLKTEAAYRRYKRPRLRMFLEAAEDYLRGFAGDRPSLTGARVYREGYPIEHLLPQKWVNHWPVDDVAAEVDRNAHVHRFGNLTLLTASLNSSVSNGPWLGANGKRAKLHDHDVFLLNRQVRDLSENGWSESLIDQRTTKLVEAFIATWPVPEGHTGELAAAAGAVDNTSVTIKELVAAGFISVGMRLSPRPGRWGTKEAVVTASGDLLLDGQTFSTPSAAGHHLRGGATNGWWFWSTPDGRRLKDVRAQYLASR
jgi:hypothetical protein